MFEAVILQALLIFINAVFASAEIAVISMNETRLKHMVQEGNKQAEKLSALIEQPAKFLSTIQELPLLEKGIRFFFVSGPDGEKVEFVEKI